METWVGFSPSPKPAMGTSKHSEQIEIRGRYSPKNGLLLFASKSGLENWLGELDQFDFRLGAKLSYSSAGTRYGATYSKIQIPKSVILVTESLGEISFSILEKAGEVTLRAKFTMQLAQADVEGWRTEVLVAGEHMREVLID